VLRSLSDPTRWNATDAEVATLYPSDDLLGEPVVRMTRAIDVRAPAPLVFRWLCELREAPFSYDWIDNLGRRSPQTLIPGNDHLVVGQSMAKIFRLACFEVDRHLTLLGNSTCDALFGHLACSYVVRPGAGTGTRLLCRLTLEQPRTLAGKARLRALAWGDLVMMSKQLRVLRDRAESSVEDAQSARS